MHAQKRGRDVGLAESGFRPTIFAYCGRAVLMPRHQWLKPGAWGCQTDERSHLMRRGRLRKLRRALTVRMCISQSVAATKRFA